MSNSLFSSFLGSRGPGSPTSQPEEGTLVEAKEGPLDDYPDLSMRSLVLSSLMERDQPDLDISLQSHNPEGSDPTSQFLQKLKQGGGYQVKIKKSAKPKNLFRFLLAKGLYEEEGIHLDEYIVLWDLFFHLQGLLSKDPSFKEKYETPLKEITSFFQAIGSRNEFPLRFRVGDPKMTSLCLRMMPLLPTKSAYFGLKGQKAIRLGFSVVFNLDLPRVKPKEARVIGVGYRDHGTKKPDEEGSPHYSEVARHFQELEIRSEEEVQGLSRDDPEFDWNRLWGSLEPPVSKKKKQDLSL